MDRSALWSTFPPRYTKSSVWLYIWPTSSILNLAMVSGIHFVSKHMISVLVSDTMTPKVAQTTMITPIIFLSCSGDCQTTRHRQRKTCRTDISSGMALLRLLFRAPPDPVFLLRYTRVPMMFLPALKRM